MFAMGDVSGRQRVSEALCSALILQILALGGWHTCVGRSHEVLVHPPLIHGTEARSCCGPDSKEQEWRAELGRKGFAGQGGWEGLPRLVPGVCPDLPDKERFYP